MKKIALIIIAFVMNYSNVNAQEVKEDFLYSNKFSILAGLIQPISLKGGNIEVNYYTKKVSFEYSHGFSLDVPVVGDYKEQGLALHLPYSTGFGVGYRISSFFDVRFESKLHSWEVYKEKDDQNINNRITDFKTFTLGIGLYYRYMPFKNNESKILQGITISSSLRYWQNVGTSLSQDQFTYLNEETNENKTLDAPNIGIANSPIIVNIGVGYTFGRN